MSERRRRWSRRLLGVPLLALLVGGAWTGRGVWRAHRTLVLDARCEGWTSTLAISADGSLLASEAGHVIHVWSLESGTLLRTFTAAQDSVMAGQSSLVFSPAGDWLAMVDSRNGVELWSLRGSESAHFPNDRDGYPSFQQLFFSPSGRLLGLQTSGGVVLRSVPSGAIVRRFDLILSDGAHAGFVDGSDARLAILDAADDPRAQASEDFVFDVSSGATLERTPHRLPGALLVSLHVGVERVPATTNGDVVRTYPGGEKLFDYTDGSFEDLSADAELVALQRFAEGKLARIEVRRLHGGELVQTFVRPDDVSVESTGIAAFSPTEDRLAVIWDKKIYVYPFRR